MVHVSKTDQDDYLWNMYLKQTKTTIYGVCILNNAKTTIHGIWNEKNNETDNKLRRPFLVSEMGSRQIFLYLNSLIMTIKVSNSKL